MAVLSIERSAGRRRPALGLGGRFWLAASVLSVCTTGPVSAETLKIMPLGDSITTGITNADSTNSWTGSGAFTFGYRGPLYSVLTSASYDFQFVGASPEPWNKTPLPTDTGRMMTGPDLRTLGQDNHRGYRGQTTDYIAANVVSWLNSDDPDVVLLHIGTNNSDMAGSAEPTSSELKLKSLVQTIVDTKPDTYVIVAQIIPLATYSAVQEYDDYIKNTLVPYFQADLGLGNHVTTVDQYSNFLTAGGSVDSSLFASPTTLPLVHPSADGYAMMAQTWFDGIQAVTAPEPGLLLVGWFRRHAGPAWVALPTPSGLNGNRRPWQTPCPCPASSC